MDIEHLEQLEAELVLPDFTNEDALELGLIIINHAKAQKVPVAVHIERNRVPIFTYLMEGAAAENIHWLYRKKRIVDHYDKSSAYIAARFSQREIANEDNSLLTSLESQAIGGSFPLRIKNVGVVGSVTVSGLSGSLDHEYTVEGLRQFLDSREV